ncbi:MAG TPA: hypothetical protein GXZ35_05375 [Acholeplasmataceae bacterium]|jgi:hypothetical protein|nr:hypothetical protein [Acholeplasmataceae bacterium]
MGIESYYVKIEIKKDSYDLNSLNAIETIDKNDCLQITFSYSFISFFEGLIIIYNFINEYNDYIYKIESLKENITVNSTSFPLFFLKMYELWNNKIKGFHTEFGLFLINPNDDFYKLYRKYFKKNMRKLTNKNHN